MGDFALNCAWDDHGAAPDDGRPVPLARQRGGRAPQRRPRRRGLLPRQLSRPDPRHGVGGGDDLRVLPARGRGTWSRPIPNTDIGWWKFNRLRMRDSKLGLLPKYRTLFGSQHVHVLPARVLTRGDGLDGAGRRLSRQLSRGPRRPPLMGLFDRYRQAPPSAFGRFRHDVDARHRRRGAHRAVGLVRRGAQDGRAARRRTDTITLTVAARHVVAHDQDVVALTLSASPTATRCRVGIPAPTSMCTCPAV